MSAARAGQLAVVILFIGTLSACGGGGGGSSGNTRTTETVVFIADMEVDDRDELYAMQDDGSGLVKLSGALLSRGVSRFKLSPDKSKVAYVEAEHATGVHDLYVVNIDGTGRVRVSQDFDTDSGLYHGNTLDTFWWSPDSTRLVYLADIYIDNIAELFLVNADGSDNHRISGSVGTTVKIGEAKWSPDSRYVAYYVRTRSRNGYITDRFAINTHDTTVGGRDSVRVSGSAIQTSVAASVQEMIWSPDSTRIAYVSYENSDSMREIYIANASEDYTSNPNRLVNVPMASGQSCDFRIFWSGDGRYLLYRCIPDLYTHDTQNTTPRNSVNVSGILATGRHVSAFGWSPDSSRVAYISDQDTDNQFELYSALPDVAGSPVKINGILTAGGNVNQFKWSPDSSRIAYVADQDTDDVAEMYTAAAGGGGAAMKVSLDNLTNSDVNGLGISWSPDGQYLAYEVENGDQTGLYVTTATDNLSARKVSGDDFTSLSQFRYQPYIDEYFTSSPWTSDSRYFLFRASVDPSDPSQSLPYYLYRVGIDETNPKNISGTLVTGGSVSAFDY